MLHAKWAQYLAHTGGRAVETVLVTALVGGLVIAAFQNPEIKKLEKAIWENFFTRAEKRATF